MKKAAMGISAVVVIFVILSAFIYLNASDDIVLVRADPELCNGIDDDNDTLIDEDFTYNDPVWGTLNINDPCHGVGACQSSFGVVYCIDLNTADCSTNWGGPNYAGSNETCNGVDDDCDGPYDEDFTYSDPFWGILNIGDPCNGLYGNCSNYQGNVECFDSSTASCDVNPGGSDEKNITEVCDSVDNDCDGENNESGVCDDFLSITLSNDPLSFPAMNPGTTINALVGNGFPLTVTIDNSSTTYADIGVRAENDNLVDSSNASHYFSVANMEWSINGIDSWVAYSSTSDGDVCSDKVPGQTCDIYHRLHVPNAQPVGTYDVGIIVTAISVGGE